MEVSPKQMGGRGVDPVIWGSSGWTLLHGLSFQHKVPYKWFLNLQHILPCGTCRENFKAHVAAIGSSHKDVRRWVYELHKRVNDMKGKTSPSYQEVVSYWKSREPLKWSEIIPFLDAVVDAHPRKGQSSCSRELAVANLTFWESLVHWMSGYPTSETKLTMEIVESRAKLRQWWKKYKKDLERGHR